jgi:hypothetical protein
MRCWRCQMGRVKAMVMTTAMAMEIPMVMVMAKVTTKAMSMEIPIGMAMEMVMVMAILLGATGGLVLWVSMQNGSLWMNSQ